MTGPVEQVRQAVHDVMYGDEEMAAGIIDESCEGIEDLWAWWCALVSMRKAIFLLRSEVEKAMIRDLGNYALRMDDSLLRVVPADPLIVIKDEGALAEYLELSTAARLAFDSRTIKVAGVRAWATEKGDNPDEVEARFFEYKPAEDQPPQMKITRMEYAPYWSLKLKMGERMEQPPPRKREAVKA